MPTAAMPRRRSPARLAALLAACALALVPAVGTAAPKADTLLATLSSPWGMAFLPDGRLLVTQKGGSLAIVAANGQSVIATVSGLPAVAAGGQGGLLDVALDPDFAIDPWIYWTYAEPGAGAEAGLRGTAVARGRLVGNALQDVAVIYRQVPKTGGEGHYGSRLAFRADKTLFVTLGERQQGSPAQDLATTLGKVVRIHRDGTIPSDNPAIPGARPETWSYGHRNPQGAAIRPGAGDLWLNEHGPQGGDELNRVTAGGNYGWPLVSYGCNYGDPVGDACRIGGGTHAPAFVEPVSYWVPTSVAPAGLVFYTGAGFPQWQGSAFMGTLAGTALWRIALSGDAEVARERLFGSLGERIRDVEQGPDGWLYLLTDSGKLIRVSDDAPAAPLSAAPSSLDFGGQSMNTTSPALAVTLTNAGATPLSVTAVAASPGFAATHGCTTLAAGASCAASVTFTPGMQGTFAGTLTVQTTTGNAMVPLAGTGERSLVTHYYRAILRRDPDTGGKAFWTGEAARVGALGLNPNEVWFALSAAFFTSAEYLAFARDDNGFVTDLYNTFFNRAPDGPGLAFWAGQLASGLPREVALSGFMFSTEFRNFSQAIFGATAVRAEIDTVTDFYRGLLARLPDSAGFTFWLARFRAAQCLGGNAVNAEVESISSLFAGSAEYASRARSNAQFVGDLFNAFLRRGGDLAGVQFWINEIASGARTRESVRQAFVASPEFQSRVAAIIGQGCAP